MNEPLIYPMGDKAITVKFGDEISEEINKRVIAFSQFLSTHRDHSVMEWVPTYTDVTIYYNPRQSTYDQMEEKVRKWLSKEFSQQSELLRRVFLPVLYGGDQGPDLEYVAEYHELNQDEVIRIHTSIDYRVYMIGFAPGFPYLGGLPEILHTPRLEKPRIRIPAGSVGIAGKQTGVYPLSTPGGWQIIGHTPVPLFNKEQEENPILLRAGDFIRFFPVNSEEYDFIEKSIEQGIYQIKIEEIK